MATLEKNWSFQINQSLPYFPADPKRQYRETYLELKDLIVSAGWTIIGSSDGSNYVTDGTDLITTEADVVIGRATVAENKSFTIFQSPAGFCDTAAGSPIQFAFSPNESPSTSPAQTDSANFRFYDPAVGADLSSGSATALPNANTSNRFFDKSDSILTAGGGELVYHGMYTDQGDFMYFVKRRGSAFTPTGIFFLGQGAGSTVNFGNYAAVFYFDGAGLGSNFVLGSTNGTIVFAADGSDVSVTQGIIAPGIGLQWPSGIESGFSNAAPRFPLQYTGNNFNVTQFNRYLGPTADVFNCPDTAGYGTVEDGDTDPVRFVIVGPLWVPVPASALPLE